MNTRRRIALLAAAAVALGSILGCSEPDRDAFAEQARTRIEGFKGVLMAELRTALRDGGPESAVAVCAERAPRIAVAASGDGVRVRRIGTRVRNPENTPTAGELAILEDFRTAGPEGSGLRVVEADGALRAYAPIWLSDPVCLTCHGPADRIDPAVRDAVARRYPDDAATGYEQGDLRGAFVVEQVR